MARAGIEPATFRFSGGRSYRLSYLATRHSKLPAKARGNDTSALSGREPTARVKAAAHPSIDDWVSENSDPDGTRTRDLRRDRATR